MRANLDFGIIDSCGGDSAAAFVDGLLEISIFGVGKDFLMPHRNHTRFRDLHTFITPYSFVGLKKQIELLFEWNRERINLNRGRVLACSAHRWAKIDRFARHGSARFGDLYRKVRYPIDFHSAEVCARCKAP